MSGNEKNVKNKSGEASRVSIKERRRQSQGGAAAAVLRENKSMLMLFAVLAAAIAVILISILVLELPAVPVCIIVVIEILMAVCLHDVPVWLHGLAVIAQIIAGVISKNIVFIVLCAVIYLLGILALRFIRD